ncbi:MAG: hypothetical protein ABW328_05920 [Ilumatobacteraceae bacterium]
MTTFALRSFAGSAADLHALPVDDGARPEVWVCDVDRPAVALGSTQRADVVAREACEVAGVDVVRRRSGGGVVLLEPGGSVWFDVVVPTAVRASVGLSDDVGASMVWLGDHVVAALGALGIGSPGPLDVHRGGMACSSTWCPLVCFAGIGPGEVRRDGVKLVGISQRRTRAGSRFQCMVHVRWSPGRLVELLAGPLPSGALPAVAVLPAAAASALPGAVAASLGAS